MDNKIYGYKIRNKVTGKFLASSGKWTSVGRVYAKKGAAIKKLNTLLKRAPQALKIFGKQEISPDWLKTRDSLLEEILSQCEVVELSESNSYPIIFEVDKLRI